MEFVSEYGLFLAKAVTVVVAVLAMAGGIVALSTRSHAKAKGHLEIKSLNQEYRNMAITLQDAILPKKALKQVRKERKKQDKTEQQAESSEQQRVFVLNFHGDIRGAAVSSLRQEISAILTVATAGDEVLLRLESAGGLVHAYGLAASQLLRIKDKALALTVAVDKVAASGGYMMACVADRIIAAPFAVIGSIGVVAQLPNFNRLLKDKNIDFEQFTAGEYKRTVTLFGETTDKARTKFQEDIEDTHELFKDFVKTHRAQVDMPRIATGEHWFATRAQQLGLVDELRTSDDYLLERSQTGKLYEVSYKDKKKLPERLFALAARLWTHFK